MSPCSDGSRGTHVRPWTSLDRAILPEDAPVTASAQAGPAEPSHGGAARRRSHHAEDATRWRPMSAAPAPGTTARSAAMSLRRRVTAPLDLRAVGSARGWICARLDLRAVGSQHSRVSASPGPASPCPHQGSTWRGNDTARSEHSKGPQGPLELHRAGAGPRGRSPTPERGPPQAPRNQTSPGGSPHRRWPGRRVSRVESRPRCPYRGVSTAESLPRSLYRGVSRANG